MPDQLTPLARISAAIEKLERLKAESTPGPWASVQDGQHATLVRRPPKSENAIHTPADIPLHWDGGYGYDPTMEASDADLIVTLHRTVEVQLETLRMAEHAERQGWGGGSKFAHMALRLADAVLGGES